MERPILVLSALDGELGELRRSMVDVRDIAVAGSSFLRGSIDGSDVVVGTVGVGKVNAAMVATLALDRFSPNVLLFTGVAGGVDPALSVGDVVVADTTVQHDAGVAGPDGFSPYQAGHLPFFDPTDVVGYQPSTGLLKQARAALEEVELDRVLDRTPDLVFGTVVTGDQFIESEVDRMRILETFGASAVEMEGAAVAQVAEHFEVDCLVIRALSDLAGAESEVDFERFLPEVSNNSIKVVRALIVAVAADS